jgi:hypothetical protein
MCVSDLYTSAASWKHQLPAEVRDQLRIGDRLGVVGLQLHQLLLAHGIGRTERCVPVRREPGPVGHRGEPAAQTLDILGAAVVPASDQGPLRPDKAAVRVLEANDAGVAGLLGRGALVLEPGVALVGPLAPSGDGHHKHDDRDQDREEQKNDQGFHCRARSRSTTCKAT